MVGKPARVQAIMPPAMVSAVKPAPAAEAERTPDWHMAITGRVFWIPAVLVFSRSSGS